MREVIYLNKRFINDDRLNDTDLLLIALIIGSKTDKLVYDRISVKYLLSFLYETKITKHLRESFNESLWKLDELGIIKDAEVMDNFVVKAKTRKLGRESGDDCLKIYFSDIAKMFMPSCDYNFLKVFRLYILIMSGMNCPESFPDFYKNKIYWEGMKALRKKSKLSKRTFYKYMNLLRDKHVFYVRYDNTNQNFPRCICRCRDRRLCKQFSLRLRTYMKTFSSEERLAKVPLTMVK